MNNICFAVLNDAGAEKLVCAHETESGEGVYLGTDLAEFRAMSADKQVEKLNTMISAVTEVVNVKRGIKFSEFQR